MRKTFFIVIAVLFAISLPAQAWVTKESYAIPSLPLTAGGTAEAKGATFSLQDLTGSPVIGVATRDAFTLYIGNIFAMEQGIIDVPGVPFGTVPLYISRAGADVRLTWEATYVNPQIFVKTGQGSGEYTSREGWVKVAASGGIISGLSAGLGTFDYRGSERAILHKNQVGGGTPEAYYKGLQAVVSAADPNPRIAGKTFLSSANAVGKVNVTMYKGWNFVSPSISHESADVVLGTSYEAGTTLWEWDIVRGDFKSPVVTFNGMTWGGVTLERGSGYLLNATKFPGDALNKVVTMVGKVPTGRLTKDMVFGWNFIGSPYAKMFTAAQLGFITGKSHETDTLWEWDPAKVPQDFVDSGRAFDGTAWPPGTALKIQRAYLYNATDAAGFRWDVNRTDQ